VIRSVWNGNIIVHVEIAREKRRFFFIIYIENRKMERRKENVRIATEHVIQLQELSALVSEEARKAAEELETATRELHRYQGKRRKKHSKKKTLH
jgi:hypothetical protein